MARWYQNRRFYIERPFPWLLIIAALLLMAAVVWVLW